LTARALVLLAVLGAACFRPGPSPARPVGYTRANPAAGAQAFINGRWLVNERFENRAMYAVSGILQAHAPTRIDTVIDLAGGWVIPPFGDAHNHMLTSPKTVDPFQAQYLNEGTFYVQVLGSRWSTTNEIRHLFNKPCALDVTWANGPITSTLGHGFENAESKAMGLFDLGAALRTREADLKRSRIAENDGYWFMDSLADLERKWPLIVAQKPDLIKLTLVYSSDSTERAPGGPPDWYAKGLRPALVQAIVRRAHDAGLRVAAHVDTGHDIEVAVRAGVDILAHNAGFGVSEGDEGTFLISDEIARLAGAHRTVVIPTAATEQDFRKPGDSSGLARDLAVQAANLRLLARYGARFAVGPDMYGLTGRAELDALRRLRVWSDADLLRMWFEGTPSSIFPDRRIGRLADGYEASFLVLEADPLADLEAVRRIRLRVKQGCVLG
jgi:imidazolonepropionase-like amidohydrolase